MSEFIVDKITNREGTSGPQIAGITTFSGTSGIVMPNGSSNNIKLPNGYISDKITLYIDVSHPDSYTIGTSSNDIPGTTKAPSCNEKLLLNPLLYDGKKTQKSLQ